MADMNDLLTGEYEAINAHMRANIGQFVNWFSFFLTFSFVALAVFVAVGDRWPQLAPVFGLCRRCPRSSCSCTCWPSPPS